MAIDLLKKLVQEAGALPTSTSTSIEAFTLDTPQKQGIKILGWGDTGEGKTYALIGFLLHGLRIFVVETDLGGSGISTVSIHLKEMGRSDLLKNIACVPLNYKGIDAFISDPNQVRIGGVPLYEWGPDLIAWEGFSIWQTVDLDEFILSMPSASAKREKETGDFKMTPIREEGLHADPVDYDAIKRGTFQVLRRFLSLNNDLTGKIWHKYVTCHEQERRKNPQGQYIDDKTQPYLLGMARKLIPAAFDVVLNMDSKPVVGSTPPRVEHFYAIQSSEKTSKVRGYKLNPTEPGDMFALWGKIISQSV